MDLDVIRKDKSGSVRFGLVAAAVLLGSLVCAKVASCFVEPKRVESVVARASVWNEQDPNRVQPYLDETREVADELKKKNLFVKAPARQHPVKQVDGILGSEVLIANKWYKAGDKIGEAKVVSVEPTQVTIEWDGKKKTFAPLASTDSAPPSGPRRPTEKPEAKKKPEPSKPQAETKVAEVVVTEAPPETDELAWMGVNLPPALKAKILEKWNALSDEEKAEAKEQWNKMPEEQKQQAVDAMEQMEG